ncbi:NAD(P)-binding protein [Patellaria atrata CBS 101060]|uniref:NAD(P)-binding protein n=1 Tax=Patellaria atrata CBS 101060 TaxID=1346257 RepID=A0A9P4SH78_9PEZI|nr:NAD(P)-binding protein [Patellaria atrata CBS 101060]
MSSSTVVLITGVSKGIGKALVEEYLLRPNCTVIGTVRDSTKYDELKSSPTADGSRLLLVSIENTSQSDPAKAVEEINAAGIDHVDIVIANAGLSPTPGPLDTYDIQDIMDAFTINTASPILLFQAVKPLLEKSRAPKWLSISSGAASIGKLEVHGAHFVSAYGISKAGLNFFTVAVHAANPNLIAFAIHPGLVQTEMGNQGARMQGLEKAPVTLKECTTKTMAVLDNATRKTTSGKFINIIDGTEFPW